MEVFGFPIWFYCIDWKKYNMKYKFVNGSL